ncbi:hypothetical protein P171DRAFT_481075 [Karstenula rhodostoma CBS 690.94]|uniref:Uncharacterized protein n=1 Tax=Karstenula rhodostoma CBS 690.94 TaxID=1392251 RepID=A0A9P4PWE2_9PLEO|nr:hypothetical protein P171DRAFT_481075 [Karstenula rhodostoma CBS 690.94]
MDIPQTSATPPLLPTLLYPGFPKAMTKKFPKSMSIRNWRVLNSQHCICWNCMPKLWDQLANHITRFHPIIDNDESSYWPYEAFRKSCDIRAVIKFMVTHLESLTIDTLSAGQNDALSKLEMLREEFICTVYGERNWNQMPPLGSIADSINVLFFRGCLTGVTNYCWVTHDFDGNPQ